MLEKFAVVIMLLCLAAAAPELKRREDHSGELLAFLVRSSQFGYTFWGDKPVSVAAYHVEPPVGNIIYGRWMPPIGKWWGEFEAKYSSINNEAYLLLDGPSGVDGGRAIVAVNKAAFSVVVDRYKAEFAARLGRDVSAIEMLERIEAGESLFSAVLEDDDLLIGLVLGYGYDNSSLYARWWQLKKALFFEVEVPLALPRPRPPFATIEEEEQMLSVRLEEYARPGDWLLRVGPLELCVDRDSSHSEIFRAGYQRLQHDLSSMEDGDGYLNAALNRIRSS